MFGYFGLGYFEFGYFVLPPTQGNANETEKLLQKQPISIFASYNFLIFLDTQLHEPKESEKTISETFGNVVFISRKN